ncbi:SIT4-associating protein [Candida tropicalis]
MSFWPFTNPLNSNNALSKFLDSVQDLSTVTVEDLIGDPTISQELLSELHSIKGNYNAKGGAGTNFLFQQPPSQEINGTSSDTASFTSSTNENNNANAKDTKGTKIIEILIQPSILTGLIDYLVRSVDFFHEQSIKEQKTVMELLNENPPETDEVEEEELEEVRSGKISKDSEEEESEDDKFRRMVQAAADILSVDLWIVSNRIIETPTIMNELWSIINMQNLSESCPTVSYLVHILDQLMDTNSIELLNFIRRQKDLVDTFLAKIEVPIVGITRNC